MRILLALDGSSGALVARDLVLDHPWPTGTRIEAVRVVEPLVSTFGVPELTFQGPIEEVLGLDAVRIALDRDAGPLDATGHEVTTTVINGRPATAIVDRARAQGADAIVIGSRGRGTIATMLLGSVSAEVATHGPCPVLVARGRRLDRALIGLDGSTVGDRLIGWVASTPVLDRVDLRLVSVAPTRVPGPGMFAFGGAPLAVDGWASAVDAARVELEGTLEAASARLKDAGRVAPWQLLEGDPAATLVDAATRDAADLVVVATQGRTGLSGLLLGSVARNVLLHAPGSVLVLREPPTDSGA